VVKTGCRQKTHRKFPVPAHVKRAMSQGHNFVPLWSWKVPLGKNWSWDHALSKKYDHHKLIWLAQKVILHARWPMKSGKTGQFACAKGATTMSFE
jgi:hypothetical protein